MQRHTSGRLATFGLVLLASAAWAQSTTTYRWVDVQGVVHYSDTPHQGAQVIQLPSAQTYQAPAAPAAATRAARAGATASSSGGDASSPYLSCGIGQPAAESSLFAPESVPVTVALSPALRDGDQVFVTVDGLALEPSSPGALTYQVAGPDRGAHSVTATVRDADGKTLCRSAITFYVQRPSVNSPAAPVRPH